jgi:hypothetical protein
MRKPPQFRVTRHSFCASGCCVLALAFLPFPAIETVVGLSESNSTSKQRDTFSARSIAHALSEKHPVGFKPNARALRQDGQGIGGLAGRASTACGAYLSKRCIMAASSTRVSPWSPSSPFGTHGASCGTSGTFFRAMRKTFASHSPRICEGPIRSRSLSARSWRAR